MPMNVRNSTADAPRVTLFGQLDDGKFVARRMAEDEVPFTKCWEHAVDQVMVYIQPDDDQLARIVEALNQGKLPFARLQEWGSTQGGTSELPI